MRTVMMKNRQGVIVHVNPENVEKVVGSKGGELCTLRIGIVEILIQGSADKVAAELNREAGKKERKVPFEFVKPSDSVQVPAPTPEEIEEDERARAAASSTAIIASGLVDGDGAGGFDGETGLAAGPGDVSPPPGQEPGDGAPPQG